MTLLAEGMSTNFGHRPVLLAPVIELLHLTNPFRDAPDTVLIDGTVGGAGHAAALLDQAHPTTRLIGIDQDPVALQAARQRLQAFGDRVRLIHGNFRRMHELVMPILSEWGTAQVAGILLDLGVSSPQLDVAERGFSFHQDAPLDMRMDPGGAVTAADLVNTLPTEELARVLREYGEERWAYRIAATITDRRRTAPLLTTHDLVEAIKDAIPAPARRTGPHPARRTFQALRIAVNDELGALEAVIPDAIALLAPRGRLGIITFHSLEDRIVKRKFADLAADCICPPELPECRCEWTPSIRIVNKRPIEASESEIQENPRARSAKLRVAERAVPSEVRE